MIPDDRKMSPDDPGPAQMIPDDPHRRALNLSLRLNHLLLGVDPQLQTLAICAHRVSSHQNLGCIPG